jgi:predicted RNase H-like HicB family nuclease
MSTLDTVRLTAVVSRDGDWYVARALEIELASQGETIEEALANLREAAELYFEDEAVPELVAPIVAPLDIHVQTT